MSQWGTLRAEFWGGLPFLDVSAIHDDMPKGSEYGPNVSQGTDSIRVDGRLRDVEDASDSFAVLAWFMRHAQWCERASLWWDLDDGPRYRYRWDDGTLVKLRGVLDL